MLMNETGRLRSASGDALLRIAGPYSESRELVVHVLRPGLCHCDAGVRISSLGVLCRVEGPGCPRARQWVLNALDDPSFHMRAFALASIAQVATAGDVVVLHKILQAAEDRIPDLRHAVPHALAKLQQPGEAVAKTAIDRICELFAHADAGVRDVAVLAAAEVACWEQSRYVDLLVEAVLSGLQSPSAGTRKAASSCFAGLGAKGGPARLAATAATCGFLAKRTGDGATCEGLQLLMAVAKRPPRRVTDAEGESAPEKCGERIDMAADAAVAQSLPLASHKSAAVRSCALRCLGAVATPEHKGVVAAMVAGLADASPQVRTSAVAAFGSLVCAGRGCSGGRCPRNGSGAVDAGRAAAVAAICSELRQLSDEAGRDCASAPAFLSSFRARRKGRCPTVGCQSRAAPASKLVKVQAALSALQLVAERGDGEIAPALAGLAGDGDAAVKQAVAEGLRMLAAEGDQDALDALSTQLSDENIEVRRTAVRALGGVASFGDVAATATLVAMLEDANFKVRMDAASSLGRLVGAGDQHALSALQRSAEDRQPDVRKASAGSLALIAARGNAGAGCILAKLDF